MESLSKVPTETSGSQSARLRLPLGIGTAMIAEVVGVCVLSGILDFVLNTKFQYEEYQCFDACEEVVK